MELAVGLSKLITDIDNEKMDDTGSDLNGELRKGTIQRHLIISLAPYHVI